MERIIGKESEIKREQEKKLRAGNYVIRFNINSRVVNTMKNLGPSSRTIFDGTYNR